MEKTILILHKDKGKFYKSLDVDSIILNYLLGYQIINNRVGFPDTALDKVIDVLNDKMISYQIVYSDKNPILKDYNEENNYLDVLREAQQNYQMNERIQNISDRLQKVDSKIREEIIEKIEILLNES